ncbi:MAG: PQQ-dependent sugar dehydrogenase [Janthinobacterium lividum]
MAGTLLAALVVLGALPVPAVAASAAPLVSRGSGRCLTVDAGSGTWGTGVAIQDCDGRPGQGWTLTALGELRTSGGARCLDVERHGTGVGARLQVWGCNGGANQRWRARPDGSLRGVESGRCLDVAGSRTGAGTRVQLWTCADQLNQRWSSPVLPLDTTPPGAPADPRVSDLRCSRATFSWSAAADDAGVTAYTVYHDGQLVQAVDGATRSLDLDVSPGVVWGLYVNARDAAGNVSQASRTVQVTPPLCAPDSTAPTEPAGVTATATGTTVRVSWKPSSDANQVRYFVQRDGATVGRLTGTATVPAETTFVDSGLDAGTTHVYRVLAQDAQRNTSTPSRPLSVTVGTGCDVCSARPVATDDDIPWGLATLPDGSVLYARRDRRQLVLLDPVTGRQTVVGGTLPGVAGTDGEGGLLGLEVSPTFATDHWIYVMHTSPTDNRIVRVRLVAGRLDLASEQVLVSGLPRNKFHDGGRLRFGPDGKLYATAGDGQNESNAQDLSVLGGKILRLDPDGSVPADNPFGTYVWSYGHRNPQGLAFDAQGRLWEQELGNARMDETNLIVRGGNYGWPACEGTVGSCAPPSFIAPMKTYAVHLGSCSGIAVVGDVLYVACLRGTRLYREVISGSSLTSTTAYLAGTYGRLRTVEPDASGTGLWLTTSTRGDKDSVGGDSAETILHVGLAGTPG